MIDAAKVSVFFIDDLQIVKPGEVGSCDLIRSAAAAAGAELHEHELEAQFRCNGSDAFINWVDNTLGVRRTANVLWDTTDAFEFRVVDDVRDLERRIRERAAAGHSARLMAGYCWKWSNPTSTGLIPDVVVGDWIMPWNAKEKDNVELPDHVPPSQFWASDPNGIDQVGCVWTAQGFEFDYSGIIFGPDLRYDPVGGGWIGDREASHDPELRKARGERFLQLVKQTYRVLLTRGLKGCYVYFMDKGTRDFVRSRME